MLFFPTSFQTSCTNMIYHTLKILHIISSSGLFASMLFCFFIWQRLPQAAGVSQIQLQTFLIILPAFLFQLISGFSIVSLQHESLNQIWVQGSFFCFVMLVLCWLMFVYFLNDTSKRFWQKCALILCSINLMCLIFFMANKI